MRRLACLFIFSVTILSFTETRRVDGYGHNKFGFGVSDRVIDLNCPILLGQTNKIYKNSVKRDQSKAYVFHVDSRYIQRSHTTNLRVEVGTERNASLRYPLLFIVQQQRQITSLEVPVGVEDNPKAAPFYYAGRTLCIDSADDYDRQGRNVSVRITTLSDRPVRFYLILKLTEDFQLRLNRKATFEISPFSPKFYGFTFSKPMLDLVQIRVNSTSTNCMTVSVQQFQCPVHDTENSIQHRGLWQTMTTTAAMTIQKSLGWFKSGFILVFVAHTDNNKCAWKDFYGSDDTKNNTSVSSWDLDYWHDLNMMGASRVDSRSKTFSVTILDKSKVEDWILWLCLLLPVLVTFLIAFAVLLLFRNRHEWMARILTEEFEEASNSLPLLQVIEGEGHSMGSTDPDPETPPGSPAPPPPTGRLYNADQSLTNTKEGRDGGTSQGQRKGFCTWKADLYIADFHCKQYHEVKKFTKRFYWTILIVAIFYSIPVYQLVLHYLRVLYRTGEYDICYYNYLCAHRLGVLIDFNHFWSNTSYMIFGIFYIIIVRQRRKNLCLQKNENQGNNERTIAHYHHPYGQHQEDEDENDGGCCSCGGGRENNGSSSPGKAGRVKKSKTTVACCCIFSKTCFRWDHGVPPHFGVFYALGVALTMEGFLSAAYHLCPNQSTFQFDTAFMYVIAVLLLLKIYQFRHPVHFGANHTFAILAGFVTISVVGLIFERGNEKSILVFKCIFYPVQYLLMILMSIYYYAVGYISRDGERITDWSILGNLGQLRSHRIYWDRLLLPIISFTICIAVLVYTELGDIGFASYLLYVLVGNVLGTTLYYVGIMKPLHGEFKNWTWVQPAIYFLAAGIIGGFSLQYFVRAPAQWELSASASRAENEECLNGWFPFYAFYDSHDAWHFLSAAALFLAFMGLLIVDDDLVTTSQQKIPVF